MFTFKLIKNEQEVAEVLWNAGRALTRTEIIELSPNKSWRANSIHIILNSMMKKGAVVTDGAVRTGKTYGRLYKMNISQESYAVMQLYHEMPVEHIDPQFIIQYLTAVIRNEPIDDEGIATLRKALDEKKKDLD